MPYVSAEDVGAYGGGPTRWEPTEILYDGGPGGWSAAEGTYGEDQEPRLGIRWNGEAGDEGGRGYPTGYRGRPVWFMVPREIDSAVRHVVKVMVLWDRRYG